MKIYRLKQSPTQIRVLGGRVNITLIIPPKRSVMMFKAGERRLAVRMPFVAKAACHVKDIDREYCGTLRDISINGLFMEMDDNPDVGSTCEVRIFFEGNHSRLLIENVAGKIIRSEKDGVAIRFDERFEWLILIPLYFYKISSQTQGA